MRSKIAFQPNIPSTVAFEFPGTLSTNGGSGQYQYFCTRNRIMWVEPVVHSEIVRLGIQPGEEFEISKTAIQRDRIREKFDRPSRLPARIAGERRLEQRRAS